MHWPRIRGLAASAGVRLRANETEISAAPWALRLGKGLYFYYMLWKIKVIETVCQTQMVAWLSGNVLALINVDTQRWARLVLGQYHLTVTLMCCQDVSGFVLAALRYNKQWLEMRESVGFFVDATQRLRNKKRRKTTLLTVHT